MCCDHCLLGPPYFHHCFLSSAGYLYGQVGSYLTLQCHHLKSRWTFKLGCAQQSAPGNPRPWLHKVYYHKKSVTIPLEFPSLPCSYSQHNRSLLWIWTRSMFVCLWIFIPNQPQNLQVWKSMSLVTFPPLVFSKHLTGKEMQFFKGLKVQIRFIVSMVQCFP